MLAIQACAGSHAAMPANEPTFQAKAKKVFAVRYLLRNGVRGSLEVPSESSTGAIVVTMDIFGAQLRTCGAKAL